MKTKQTQTAEEYLDEQFPKGNKSRGKALLIYAVSRLEGIKIGEQEGKQELWDDLSVIVCSYLDWEDKDISKIKKRHNLK
jgi:hypothetical protein